MNATPMNLTPGNAVQAQPQAGKPADAAVSDTPFSQVLSGEIARKGAEVREDAELDAGEAAQQPAIPADIIAAAGFVPPETGKTAEQDVYDAEAGAPSTLPDALLGLVVPTEWTKLPAPAPAGTAEDRADGLAVGLDVRASRPVALPQQDGRPVGPAAWAGQTAQARPALTPQTDAAAAPATTAAAATAFAEQLAAARQSDPAKVGERVAELLSHPGMQAAMHTAAAETVPALADPTSSRMAPAVGTPAWGQALGDKLVWMAVGTQQTASLTLNPPDLGPLQVVLDVKNDQATASFYAAQPEVRQALESALPRLRDMMSDAGIQLGQATVSADTPRQNDTPERQAARIAPESSGTGSAATATQPAMAATLRMGRGLVDTFA